MDSYTLEYVDVRPVWIPKLKFHKGGVNLPGKTNTIKVTEKERHYLLKMKNGKRPCFKEVHETRTYRRQNTDGGNE